MDLNIHNQRFLVCGASSGFGYATAKTLLREGAYVIAVARREERLKKNYSDFGSQTEIIAGDLTDVKTIETILEKASRNTLHGAFINSGGPPAATPLETKMEQWDKAWQSVMRWKIELALKLVPGFIEQKYGRILFLESKSVKQPIPQLVLSNAFRAGVTGFAKSLATEIAGRGVTVNVLAPGAHDTPAIKRVIEKQSQSKGISYEAAKMEMENSIPVNRMGTPDELASLASWLLSPRSSYVTGQTISHDGGAVSGLFG